MQSGPIFSAIMPSPKLIRSSEAAPCPICEQRTGACAWSSDQKTVLCATLRQNVDISAVEAESKAEPTKGEGFSPSKKKRVEYHKRRNKSAEKSAAKVEIKVDDLVMMVAGGYDSKETAQVSLAAWCKEEGHDKFAASQLFRKKLKALETDDDEESPRLLREYEKIGRKFGDRLKFNELRKEIELDGEFIDPAMAKLELVVTHRQNLKGCREDISDSLVMLSKQNAYSPVVEYLKTAYATHGQNNELINSVAARYLGTNEPIHQTLIKRFLIAAVARAFEPGCKHDCALILQGPQGYFKSTFFKILASADWFDDSLGLASDKDERLKLHRSWILEWAELETVFKRRDVSQVKAFMSSAIDILRPPYGRSIQVLKRSSVIVGTTNQAEFLADTTGNRRFWVVPIANPLDITALAADRDRIWASAVALYKSKEPWWLSKKEEQQVDNQRSQFEAVDPWVFPIQEYVNGRPAVSTEEVLMSALEMEKSKHNSGHARRVADIMRKLGWEQTANPVAYGGTRKRIWRFEAIQKTLQVRT